MGSVTLKAMYGRKKYLLEVIPLQAIVLSALDNGELISYKQLKKYLALKMTF